MITEDKNGDPVTPHVNWKKALPKKPNAVSYTHLIEFNSNSIPLISTVFHPVKANMES